MYVYQQKLGSVFTRLIHIVTVYEMYIIMNSKSWHIA